MRFVSAPNKGPHTICIAAMPSEQRFASIITGSLVIEKVFQIPGVGRYFIISIQNRDYPMIMGTTCLLALLLIIFTLISDIAYKIVDPRITLTAKED